MKSPGRPNSSKSQKRRGKEDRETNEETPRERSQTLTGRIQIPESCDDRPNNFFLKQNPGLHFPVSPRKSTKEDSGLDLIPNPPDVIHRVTESLCGCGSHYSETYANVHHWIWFSKPDYGVILSGFQLVGIGSTVKTALTIEIYPYKM